MASRFFKFLRGEKEKKKKVNETQKKKEDRREKL